MSTRWQSGGGCIRTFCAVSMVLASLVAACDSAPPTAPSPPIPSPTPRAALFPRYQLSGLVTDQAGAPVPDARVTVYYGWGGAIVPNPPATCPRNFGYCWFSLRSNGLGEYATEFAADPMTGRGFAGGGIGYVESDADGTETTVQWLPTTSATATLNLRLRRARPIRAGESTTVTLESNSSLCTDGEDLWSLGNRCEIVRIASGAGTLVVEARATQGTSVPLMFWYTSGNYRGGVRQTAPGTVTIGAGGGTYLILVGLPDGTASQQFQVSTSLLPPPPSTGLLSLTRVLSNRNYLLARAPLTVR